MSPKGENVYSPLNQHFIGPDERLHLTGTKNVGIVGVPPRRLIAELQEAGVRIHDLDALLGEADFGRIAALLPQVYCAILRTVVLNALQMAATLDLILIDIGPGKCDGARYSAEILRRHLQIPILTCLNLDRERLGNPLCRSALPLPEKLQRITAGVQVAEPPADFLPTCSPSAGFWGVPPRDFGLLELFPATTHVYGWSRCMENKTPADHELEMQCRLEIPTIFFAQSFCPKTALARDLAARHPRALYLDADLNCGGSAKAKIQAFLELSGVGRC